MNIILNGKPHECDAADLERLLESLDHAPDSVATALNGDFVAHAERARHRLADGDRVDVIAPMAGG